jgi:hypothetical protein
MDQNYLDYAEGLRLTPDGPETAPDEPCERTDRVRAATVLLSGMVAFGVALVLDSAGVDRLGRPWSFLIYGITLQTIMMPSWIIVWRGSRRTEGT